MIKDAGGKFDDYSISPKIRTILQPWASELTEKNSFIDSANSCIKMSCYQFNRQEILQKVKDIPKKKLLRII